MNTNRVTGSVSGKDQETVPAAIATIRQSFPFLIDLTTAEHVAMAKLGDKGQGFVKRASGLCGGAYGLCRQQGAICRSGVADRSR